MALIIERFKHFYIHKDFSLLLDNKVEEMDCNKCYAKNRRVQLSDERNHKHLQVTQSMRMFITQRHHIL